MDFSSANMIAINVKGRYCFEVWVFEETFCLMPIQHKFLIQEFCLPKEKIPRKGHFTDFSNKYKLIYD